MGRLGNIKAVLVKLCQERYPEQCNFESDRIRYSYLIKAKELPIGKSYPNVSNTVFAEDAVIVTNFGDRIVFEEHFYEECWNALYQKDGFSPVGQTEDQLINRFVEFRIKPVVEAFEERILEWSWDSETQDVTIVISNSK